MKKYYYAYGDRYKEVHSKGLLWFSEEPTPELLTWIEFYQIPIGEEICEIGCGEGRDAIFISKKGYRITGIDVSEAAISKCKERSQKNKDDINWVVGDALSINDTINKKFKWIYSIATLHMLVDDIDRAQFLKSLYDMLDSKAKLLLVIMGDGKTDKKTDISNAFKLQERIHAPTGFKMMVAGTSYRGVDWDYHKQELIKAGFKIEKELDTFNMEYGNCMTVYLSRK